MRDGSDHAHLEERPVDPVGGDGIVHRVHSEQPTVPHRNRVPALFSGTPGCFAGRFLPPRRTSLPPSEVPTMPHHVGSYSITAPSSPTTSSTPLSYHPPQVHPNLQHPIYPTSHSPTLHLPSQKPKCQLPHSPHLRPISSKMRSPGIDPGSITWQATIITTRPRTLRLPWGRLPSIYWHMVHERTKNGEAGYRSLCLMHAKHALYHLSYIPT